MALSAKPLHPLFAAELTGADLATGIDPATRDAIERAMDEHAIVVLPNQRLDDDKQIAFASLYGPLELSPPVHSKDGAAAATFRIQNRCRRPPRQHSRAGCRALDLALARAAWRLHADRRRDQSTATGAPSTGATPSWLRAKGALYRLTRLSRHRLADRGGPRPPPRPPDTCDAATFRLCPSMAAGRSGHLG